MSRHHFHVPTQKSDALTPAQWDALAGSMRDLPPEYQLTAAELEMMEEDIQGKPLRYGEPAAAGYAMKRRLAVLRLQKAQAISTMDTCDESMFAELGKECQTLDGEIIAAKRRLDDYIRQQGTAN